MTYSNDHVEITLVKGLHPKDSICSLAEAINNPQISGRFGDYLYCVKNGRQVILGHGDWEQPLHENHRLITAQTVFMSKNDGNYHRRPSTWEEMRELLSQGWVLGTNRYPGIKIWYPDNGRNYRRSPEEIYVFER